jgi:hypothetical protein
LLKQWLSPLRELSANLTINRQEEEEDKKFKKIRSLTVFAARDIEPRTMLLLQGDGLTFVLLSMTSQDGQGYHRVRDQ